MGMERLFSILEMLEIIIAMWVFKGIIEMAMRDFRISCLKIWIALILIAHLFNTDR